MWLWIIVGAIAAFLLINFWTWILAAFLIWRFVL